MRLYALNVMFVSFDFEWGRLEDISFQYPLFLTKVRKVSIVRDRLVLRQQLRRVVKRETRIYKETSLQGYRKMMNHIMTFLRIGLFCLICSFQIRVNTRT